MKHIGPSEPSQDAVTSNEPMEKAFVQETDQIRIWFLLRVIIKIQCLESL